MKFEMKLSLFQEKVDFKKGHMRMNDLKLNYNQKEVKIQRLRFILSFI
jgi:hypothetical protein